MAYLHENKLGGEEKGNAEAWIWAYIFENIILSQVYLFLSKKKLLMSWP